MNSALMNLRILLPFQIFAEKKGVSRIVAESHEAHLESCHTGSIASRLWNLGFSLTKPKLRARFMLQSMKRTHQNWSGCACLRT